MGFLSSLLPGGSKDTTTNSSSQSSTTSNVSTSTTTDRRVVADGGGIVLGDGTSASIAITDAGALHEAATLSEAALVNMTKLATQALNVSTASNKNAGELSASALGQLKDAFTSANEQAQAVASGNKTLAIVGMIVAALLGVGYLQQRGKK